MGRLSNGSTHFFDILDILKPCKYVYKTINITKTMIPSRTILLKRRKSGNSGPPSTLKNGELAFNEVDKTLYYGSGSDENDNAVEIITIAGNHTNILKDASIVTSNNTPQPTNQYLVINVNGTQKAIRLYDL